MIEEGDRRARRELAHDARLRRTDQAEPPSDRPRRHQGGVREVHVVGPRGAQDVSRRRHSRPGRSDGLLRFGDVDFRPALAPHGLGVPRDPERRLRKAARGRRRRHIDVDRKTGSDSLIKNAGLGDHRPAQRDSGRPEAGQIEARLPPFVQVASVQPLQRVDEKGDVFGQGRRHGVREGAVGHARIEVQPSPVGQPHAGRRAGLIESDDDIAMRGQRLHKAGVVLAKAAAPMGEDHDRPAFGRSRHSRLAAGMGPHQGEMAQRPARQAEEPRKGREGCAVLHVRRRADARPGLRRIPDLSDQPPARFAREGVGPVPLGQGDAAGPDRTLSRRGWKTKYRDGQSGRRCSEDADKAEGGAVRPKGWRGTEEAPRHEGCEPEGGGVGRDHLPPRAVDRQMDEKQPADEQYAGGESAEPSERGEPEQEGRRERGQEQGFGEAHLSLSGSTEFYRPPGGRH